MFRFNSITRVFREKEEGSSSASNAGAASEFKPTAIEQGQGVFDMKKEAQQKEQNQEDTGSTSDEQQGDSQVASKDSDDKDEQSQADEDKTSQDATQEQEKGGEGESTGYTYKGVEVTVTNTPEMEEAFKEKGLDIDAVNKELYSEDGLTEDTRAKLDEAFGKMAVGMYLEGLEKSNEAAIKDHERSVSAWQEKIDKLTTEATGGKFDDVMSWANDNLDTKEYEAYAEVINGDNELNIKLALENLTRLSGLNKKEDNNSSVDNSKNDKALLSAITSSKGAVNTPLSGREYNEGFTNGEYRKDPDAWDARRQAGIDAGIGQDR